MSSSILSSYSNVHDKFVHSRRIERLKVHIANLLQPDWTVIDIGSGDGRLAHLIKQEHTGINITGYDLLVRDDTFIKTEKFDGRSLPLAENSVNAVLLVDVLHHTDDPNVLLAEATRVASDAIIIKDHRLAKLGAVPLLKFMDYLGNRSHGVNLPYNYWGEEKWRHAWQQLGLEVESFETELGLYPWPTNYLFESGLHYLAKLGTRNAYNR